MDVYVRLYWQHDLDLIALHYSPSVPKIGYLMKAALSAHVRNIPYEVHVPDKIMFNQPIKSCNANVKLYEGKDDDLIEYVKSLHYGLRSNAMKQILRNYLSHMFILPYAQGSGVYFQSKIHTNKSKNVKITNKKALQVEKSGPDKEKPDLNKTRPDPNPVQEPDIVSPEETKQSKEENNPVKEEIPKDYPLNSVDDTNSDDSNENFDLFGAIESMM